MNFPDTLLRASDGALSAFTLARAAEAAIPAPSEVDIERVLATLPDKACAGARVHPDVSGGYFLFAEWDPSNRSSVALYTAVHAELGHRGIGAELTHAEGLTRWAPMTPCKLYVSLASLHAAAEKVRSSRAAWLEDARHLWIQRCGEGATIDPREDSNGSHVLFSVPPGTYVATPPDQRRALPTQRPQHLLASDVMERSAAEAVATAASAIRVVRWTVEHLSSRWAEVTGGDVVKGSGLWKGADVRSVPTLIFRVDEVEHTEAVEDIFGLTVEQILDRAAQGIGLGDIGAAATETSATTAEPHSEEAFAAEGDGHAEEPQATTTSTTQGSRSGQQGRRKGTSAPTGQR